MFKNQSTKHNTSYRCMKYSVFQNKSYLKYFFDVKLILIISERGTLDDRIEANNNVCKMLFDVCRLCCHHLPVYYSVNVFVRPCFYFCLCKTQHVRRSLPYKEALQH